MANLTKSFSIPKKNLELTIEVEFDGETISELEVSAYNSFTNKAIDLTPIFDTFPEFSELIDNIDWSELYSEYQMEAAENKLNRDAA